MAEVGEVAHRAHFGAGGLVSVPSPRSLSEVTSCTEDKIAMIERERQQHETTPKIWPYATANSKTRWRGSDGIARSDEAVFLGNTNWMNVRLKSFTVFQDFLTFPWGGYKGLHNGTDRILHEECLAWRHPIWQYDH